MAITGRRICPVDIQKLHLDQCSEVQGIRWRTITLPRIRPLKEDPVAAEGAVQAVSVTPARRKNMGLPKRIILPLWSGEAQA
ncbi:MAG: hypothetical protein GX495_08980 [Chloroflexi bacterium]|nr:hypothetical protein [Chloroflexota bacterium]